MGEDTMIGFRRGASWKDDARFMWPDAIGIVQRQRNIMICIALALSAACFCVGRWVLPAPTALESTPKWSRDSLVAWSQKFESDTDDVLVRRFDECSRLHVREAIPFAFLHARSPAEDEGRTQWHVLSARRFLAQFTDDEILDSLKATMKGRPETSPAILRRTLELIR